MEAGKALGPVLYAVRLDDGVIKIGCTINLLKRVATIRSTEHSTTVELLAFMPGDVAAELALHRQLTAHRARGREYYRATAEVMAAVDRMRATVGMEPL